MTKSYIEIKRFSDYVIMPHTVEISVKSGLSHPGHSFSGSSGSDPVCKLSGLDHVRNKIVRLTTWKLINASRVALS